VLIIVDFTAVAQAATLSALARCLDLAPTVLISCERVVVPHEMADGRGFLNIVWRAIAVLVYTFVITVAIEVEVARNGHVFIKFFVLLTRRAILTAPCGLSTNIDGVGAFNEGDKCDRKNLLHHLVNFILFYLTSIWDHDYLIFLIIQSFNGQFSIVSSNLFQLPHFGVN